MLDSRFKPTALVLISVLCGCGEKPTPVDRPANALPPTASIRPPVANKVAPVSSKVEPATIQVEAVGKPIAPFKIAAPPRPSGKFGPDDVSGASASVLRASAHNRYKSGRYPDAIRLQHLAIRKGDDGLYNMACYCGMNQDVEQAIYWLQRAAFEEGVDAEWAAKDSDLDLVRADSRWPTVLAFLKSSAAYWRTSKPGEAVLVIPKTYQKGTAIPLVVWLHGHRSNPTDIIKSHRGFTDRFNVALLGVSATIQIGPKRFTWSERPNEDARRIELALKQASARLTIDRKQVILFGFSQGAQVAAEIVARHPSNFAGAIAFSPGADANQLTQVTPSPLLRQRTLVVVCGAQEHQKTVRFTNSDAEWFRQAGAKVVYKKYEGMSAHNFPPDYLEQLPKWIKLITKHAN